MATANDVLAQARSQIGYKEGKNNWTKYGAEYGMNNVSWCMIFVWWCFKHAGAESLIKKTASCTAEWNAMKSRAVSKNSLKPGDIVFFDWDHSGDCDHVGIVEAAGPSQVTTIEGNTSAGNSGSQSNGDGVYRRYRTYSQIAKAFRPAYDNSGGGTCNVTVQEVKNGSKGGSVYVLQAFLKAKGYYTGKVDGEAGSLTEKAIKAFQKAMGLSQDGIAGTNTWKAVFK